jgi:hypothetical protein
MLVTDAQLPPVRSLGGQAIGNRQFLVSGAHVTEGETRP